MLCGFTARSAKNFSYAKKRCQYITKLLIAPHCCCQTFHEDNIAMQVFPLPAVQFPLVKVINFDEDST